VLRIKALLSALLPGMRLLLWGTGSYGQTEISTPILSAELEKLG
jgi:hypothetical protein